jgi:CheY-like chemotaxis protein
MSNADSLKILIVDDNPNNLLSLHGLLEEYLSNVHIIEADSGIGALSILMKESVDLIFLDIQMPKMDGFETAKMIQSRQKMRHVPIVFLTAAYKSAEFQKKGLELGATDYLTKPINTTDLISKVKTYLRLIQQERLRHEDQRELTQKQLAKKTVADTSPELQLLKMIVNSTETLEKKAIEAACLDCLSEIENIKSASKQLLQLYTI